MSDFFATEQDKNQARIDASLAAPEQRHVGFFDDPNGSGGLLEGANTVIPRAFANVGEGVHAGLGYLARQIPDESIPLWHSFDSEALGRFFDQQVAEDRSFRQRWTVDPSTRSEAAGMVSDLAETLATFSIGGVLGGPEAGAVLGPTIAGASYGSQTYGELRSRGVDPTTARGAGLITGTAMGAMGFAPVAWPSTANTLAARMIQRAASGAGINLAFGVGQRGSLNAYLNAQGYPELAREYQWYDGRAATTDAIFGAVFGAVFGHGAGSPHEAVPHEPPPTPREESDLRDLGAAALIERGALQDETAFGVPANHASRRWAQDALDRAESQAASDEPIDVGPVPDGVEFIPLDGPRDLSPEQHLEEARQLGTDGEFGDALAHAYLAKLGGAEGADEVVRMLREDASPEDQVGVMARVAELRRQADPMAPAYEAMADYLSENGATEADLEALRAQARARGIDDSEGALYSMGAERRVSAEGARVGMKRGRKTATIEEILALRDELSAKGFGRAGGGSKGSLHEAMARRLASRYGETFTANNIRQRLFKYERAVASGAREPAKYSLTENPAFSTEAELNARASELLGADWTALSRAGFVEMWPTAADIPHGGTGVPPGVKAVHFPSQRRTYFVASNIRPRELKGLILHEIGVHHGMEDMLGKRGWNEVLRQLEGMVESDHPDVVAARRDAERFAGNSADIEEETLAYLIENQADLPLVQSLLSRLRQWLIKTFGSTFGMRLTVDDLRGLALSSLRRVAEQARREAGDFTTIGPMDEALASQSGRPQPPFYSTVERVVSESKTARASGSQWLATISKAPGVKREELDWIGLPDFLKATDAPISREDVLSFIRANGVQVEETVLSEGGADTSEIQREMLPLIEERDRLSAALGERLALPDSPEGARITEINDRIRQLQERRDQQLSGRNATRWSQYALPGGENYRELLLRLPEERKSLDQWRVLRPDGISDGLYSSEQAAQTRAQAINGTVERAQNQEVIAGFHTQHWSGHSNILAHVRFNERVDANGARTLFMEEVQSDWHQGGRERGYKTPLSEEDRARIQEAVDQSPRFNSVDELVAAYRNGLISNIRGEELSAALDRATKVDRGVPDAPFKNNAWAALALKRMIRFAAEQGMDQIAWTRGEHQIERFNLERHVKELRLDGLRSGPRHAGDTARHLHVRTHNERDVDLIVDGEGHPSLEEAVGKDVAEQLRATKPNADGVSILRGQDFKMGGEGMTAFYDRILPNIANDLGKKYGARVGETEVDRGTSDVDQRFTIYELNGRWKLYAKDSDKPLTDKTFKTGGDAERWLQENGYTRETVHSLPITPEMRAQALEGQPLFSFGGRRAKTANEDRLTLARELERAGKDEWFIWHNTGWAKGVDGQWRFEIPDDGADFAVPWGTLRRRKSDTPLSEAFNHPGLFEAYPVLRDVSVRIISREGEGGSWDPEDGVIEISANGVAATARRTMLHEIQHAIQDIEEFAPGTHWETITNSRRMKAVREAEVQRIQSYKWISEQGRADWIAEIDARRETYRHASGEAEARAVSNRRSEDSGIPPAEAVRAMVNNPQLLWNPRRRNWEVFRSASEGAGKNGGNSVEGTNDARRRDTAESPDFQQRVREVRDLLEGKGQDETGRTQAEIPGSVGRVAGEHAGRGPDGERADGERDAEESLRRRLRAIVEVSGLQLTKKPEIDRGDYRAQIDTPFASEHDAILRSETKSEKAGGPTYIDFDLIDGSDPRETRLPGVHIMTSRVADRGKGLGIGTWLYRQMIEWASRRSLPVYSDTLSVSREAQAVYDRLRDMGYVVERLGNPKRASDGSLLSTDGTPVFRVSVRDPVEEPLPSAPLPRDDYQIDGPTLRERQEQIDAARARQDAYDALSPAEQAIADNPEMKFSVGPPRKPERRRVNLPHPFIGAADVIIRPTQRHLEAMLKEQHQRDVQSIRWGITASGELVAWDGMQAMHGSVGESLGGRFVETGEIEHALEIDPVFAALERVRNEEGARDPSRVADTLGITPATAKRMLARDGMLTARDMMDILKQEKAEAAEMRKGFEAAARCAARHGAQQAGHILIPLSTGSAVTDAWMGQVLGMGAAIPLGVTATPYLAQASRSANPNSPLARARLENMAADAAGASHRLGQAAGLDNPSGFDAGEGASFSDQAATDAELPSLDEGPPLPPEGYVKPGQAVPEDAP